MLLFDWLTKKQYIAQSFQIFKRFKTKGCRKNEPMTRINHVWLDRLNLRSRFTDLRWRTFVCKIEMHTLKRQSHMKLGFFLTSYSKMIMNLAP